MMFSSLVNGIVWTRSLDPGLRMSSDIMKSTTLMAITLLGLGSPENSKKSKGIAD